MVLLGVSLLVVSLSFLCYRHPPRSWPWRLPGVVPWVGQRSVPLEKSPPSVAVSDGDDASSAESGISVEERDVDRQTMPPPPRPPPAYSETHSASPETTPKARPTPAPRDIPAPPALSLSVDDAVDDDDRPAVFPAPNSAQRARGPPKLVPLAAPQRTGLMPPPATPLRAPPSAASSLRIPQTTSVAPTLSSARAQTSRKVTLAPNHSPLDWAALSATLRPLARLRRVTPSELKKHSGRKGKPAWTALAGTVYDMTPYLPFHPGGEPELLRAAGRDGSRLFGEVHPWVNFQGMLSGCVVGILVSEGDEGAANRWDEVD